MTDYTFNNKNISDTKVIFIDKQSKKLSLSLNKYLSKEDIKLLDKVIKKDLGKSESISVITTTSTIVLFVFDYSAKEANLQKLGAKFAKAVANYKNITVYIDEFRNDFNDFILGVELGSYRFNKYFTQNVEDKKVKFEKINFISLKGVLKKDIKKALMLSDGVNYARDLVNEPANYLTPKTFADSLSKLKTAGLTIEVLEESELKKLKFNLILAVSSGSTQKPKVAILSWKGNAKKKNYDLTLVGKGITFDSGGLSIKTGGYMEGMHTDMAGAAAVAGVIKSAATLGLKKNILGLVGLVENMPSGSAYRVNDIIKSMSGQTVEVLNTDAEGRLVLADLLTYAQKKYKSKNIVDLATLTGAVSGTFGPVYAGLFSDNDDMIKNLTISGEKTGDRLWRLPMDDYFNKALNSKYADMQNSGSHRVGGGSQAACFLRRFIDKDTAWAHLDIAGTARESLDETLYAKGATGFGVKLLIDYIENLK